MAKKALAKTNDDLALLQAQVSALLPRLNAGDLRAQREFREIAEGHPELWSSLGNVAFHAENSLILAAAGDNTVIQEAIKTKLEEMRRDLLDGGSSPLERLLVNRIVANWMALHYAEAKYHHRLSGGISWGDNDGYQREISRIERRYQSAIRNLSTVRRLVLPTVQVNVADRQINMVKS